jgi:16S rRNA (uracil1498-N3)-methyltransferase
MHLFYTPDLRFPFHTLSEEESKHCTIVLRLSEGDEIYLTNGKGVFCKAVIRNVSSKACASEISWKIEEYGKRKFNLSIAIAPTKNIERFEWFAEKSTEIGIDEIIPLNCRFSERKEIKKERLEKVIIAAMKQSQKAYLPSLSAVQKFKDFIIKPFSGDKFIAHCIKGEKNLLSNLVKPTNNLLILIGPEGDFSPEEVELAINEGFIPVSLGDSRLRTETAGVVACNTANLINQTETWPNNGNKTL